MSVWNIKTLISKADSPGNVVEFPEQRPTLDALYDQAKSAIREQRAISKEQDSLTERRSENATRLANVQAAIVERLSEIGIDLDAG